MKQDQLLIVFEGLDAMGWYEQGKDTHYAELLMSVIRNEVYLAEYNQIVVMVECELLSELQKEFAHPELTFVEFSPKAFQHALVTASVVLCVPSPQIALDVLAAQVPVVFLPPATPDQYQFMNQLESEGAATLSLNLKKYAPNLELSKKTLPEKMSLFLSQWQALEKLDEVFIHMGERLNHYLSQPRLLTSQLVAQNHYFSQLNQHGTIQALNVIERVLA